jgi:hypothetical protein
LSSACSDIFFNGAFMASQRQIEANRANGAKGGPKTQAGKEQSRLGSLKHGLTASTLVVLPEEHEHEYQELLRGFRESFQPQNPAEEAMVLRLAHARWRSLRSRRVETGILSITANAERRHVGNLVENCPDPHTLNPHEAIAVAFMTMPAGHWQMYMRYDTTISRDFFKALDALTKLQRVRNTMQKTHPPQAPLTFAAGAGASLSESGIRSVSQNSSLTENPDEQKELTHESKQQKETSSTKSRPARQSHRPAAHSTEKTLNQVSRRERNLQRLLAARRILLANRRVPARRNKSHVGRPGVDRKGHGRRLTSRCGAAWQAAADC